jgi:tripartite-type tricarboxylate transporter receptor subunit TctC
MLCQRHQSSTVTLRRPSQRVRPSAGPMISSARASKGDGPGPCILRGPLRGHLRMTGIVSRLSWALVAALVSAAPASAQGEFYRGKQIQILIAGTAGGGIDIGARIVSRYLGKYIAGNPTIIPQLMPGAGGIRMIDYMNSVAPKDGTVIGITPPGPIIEPLIGKRQASYRMSDFIAIGAMTKEVSLCISWGGSKFKTIDDAIKSQMVVAGTGAGSSPDIYPVILNEVLHTKFKVITGYQGSQETIIAIERGEVDGRCGWGWSSLKSTKPDWIRDNKINVLLQLALAKSPSIRDAPLVMDLVKDTPDRQMLTLLFGPLSINKPFFGPPGMAAERVAELRKAFADAMNDAELRAEVIKLTGEDLEPTSGENAQKLVAEMYATPEAVAHRLRDILSK